MKTSAFVFIGTIAILVAISVMAKEDYDLIQKCINKGRSPDECHLVILGR